MLGGMAGGEDSDKPAYAIHRHGEGQTVFWSN